MQWLTLGEWSCSLGNGPKLAVGQPNSSWKEVVNGNPHVKLSFNIVSENGTLSENYFDCDETSLKRYLWHMKMYFLNGRFICIADSNHIICFNFSVVLGQDNLKYIHASGCKFQAVKYGFGVGR